MQKVTDRGTLKLIRQYLRSRILKDGLISQSIEGTTQGSPLCPLLSNITLDELDKKLETRGRSFVRYSDDCSIYVKNEKSVIRARPALQSK